MIRFRNCRWELRNGKYVFEAERELLGAHKNNKLSTPKLAIRNGALLFTKEI
jgi:hypothetical protein